RGLQARLLPPHLPEALGRPLRRSAAPRAGPPELQGVPLLPAPHPPRSATGPRALRVAAPALRIRAGEAALRHPLRYGPDPEDHGVRAFPAAGRARLGRAAGSLPTAAGAAPPVRELIHSGPACASPSRDRPWNAHSDSRRIRSGHPRGRPPGPRRWLSP